MCHAILEVRYRNKIEPDQLLPMTDAESMAKRMADLEGPDTVERIRVFTPSKTRQRETRWTET